MTGNFGYNIARMKYRIVIPPVVAEDLTDIRAYDAAWIKDQIRKNLTHQPTRVSKSRIKRLKGLTNPQYRLRAGGYRIFYDVVGDEVHILAIVPKSRAQEWLKKAGEFQ